VTRRLPRRGLTLTLGTDGPFTWRVVNVTQRSDFQGMIRPRTTCCLWYGNSRMMNPRVRSILGSYEHHRTNRARAPPQFEPHLVWVGAGEADNRLP
jgi:hypothetical protein